LPSLRWKLNEILTPGTIMCRKHSSGLDYRTNTER
jgi:hypothetical protein